MTLLLLRLTTATAAFLFLVFNPSCAFHPGMTNFKTTSNRHSNESDVILSASSSFQSSSSSSTMDVFEGSARGSTDVLLEWATTNQYGVQTCNGFVLQDDPHNNKDKSGTNQDVFAVTTQHIPAESPLLFVPSDMIWTSSKAQQELGITSVDSMLLDYSVLPKFYLFCKVLSEMSNMHSPFHHAWLDAMPRFYSNGASMTDFCFCCLPPYAAKLALEDEQLLRNFEEALQYTSVEVTDSAAAQWAYNVVQTRSMPCGNDYALIPIADYFNHGGDNSNAVIQFDDTGNCYAYSTRDIAAGSPLLISYGDSTNPSKLLAQYGFLDDSSSAHATYCKYIIDHPTPEITNMGYPQDMVFYQDGGISMTVWDILLYNEVLNAQEQQQFYQAFVNGDDTTKQQFHEQYFAQTHKVLQQHVAYLMNELEELEIGIETQAKRGSHFFRYPRLPLLLKHNEFVKSIMEKVQLNVDGMV